jgi:hypothetical protein
VVADELLKLGDGHVCHAGIVKRAKPGEQPDRSAPAGHGGEGNLAATPANSPTTPGNCLPKPEIQVH